MLMLNTAQQYAALCNIESIEHHAHVLLEWYWFGLLAQYLRKLSISLESPSKKSNIRIDRESAP